MTETQQNRRRLPHRRRWPAWCAGALVALCLPLVWPDSAAAQVTQDTRISTQGTQFVRPEPPKPPEPPTPPSLPPIERPQLAPAQPQPAAVQPPPAAAPPRYPSVVFLLDTSDSMLNQEAGKSHTRLEEAKGALARVVRNMSRETRVQMWTFDSRLKPLEVPGLPRGTFIAVGRPGLRDQLLRKISNIRTGGGTNLYQAVIKALDIFAAPEDQPAYRSGQRFPVLVVISDGEDGGKTGHTLDSVLAARRKFPLVTINTIGFHVAGAEKWFRELCRLATNPMGCATADNPERLQAILESFSHHQG